MHRSALTIAVSILFAQSIALVPRCAAQVANAPVQVPPAVAAAPDPFTLDATPTRLNEPPSINNETPSVLTATTALHDPSEPELLHASAHSAELPRLERPGLKGDTPALAPSGDASTLVTVGGSLTLVLGLFLLVTWALRRNAPAGSALLPREVVEMLGRAPLPGRQQMHLVRLGSKLLLLNVTPNGAETLSEVTDPIEVDRLIGFCHQRAPHSSTAAFHSVLEELSRGGKEEYALDNDRPRRGPRTSHSARAVGGADV